MKTFIYQTQRVLIVVAMSAMMGYGEDPKSAGGSPAPTIEQTLVAHPGETLQVNSRYASQTIDSQAGNQVSVVVTRRVLEQYEHDADRILREHEVEISRHDHGITIYTDVDDAVSERWQADYKTFPPLRVHVKVLVPKQGYDVVARTTFGSQDIQNINGSVHADARQDAIINNVLGDIEVNSIFGALTIRDVGGSVLRAKAREKVDIKHVKGPHVYAASSFGSLVLDDIAGFANAKAREDINISNVGRDVEASSSFGSVTIRNVVGRVLDAKAREKVDIKHVKGPHVHAASSFGSLVLDDIAGSANVRAREDINVSNVGGDLEASSSFGRVTIRNVAGSVLHAKAREKVDIKTVQRDILDASSSFGSLVLDDVTGVAYAHARKAITASNVGGDLSASSSFGSVTIHHVGGSVRAKARGDIELKNVAKEASINSSFGKVRRVQ